VITAHQQTAERSGNPSSAGGPGGARCAAPGICLKVQLESELDLSRIERIVASRTNLAKGCGASTEVRRARYGIHSVAAEPGIVEGRVIQDVEKLRPELQSHPF